MASTKLIYTTEDVSFTKKAMTEIKVDRMTGKSITWSEDGEPTKDPTVVIVQGGVYKILHAE